MNAIMTLHYTSGREEQVLLKSTRELNLAKKDAQRLQREGILKSYTTRRPGEKK